MGKLIVVIKREYLERIRSRWFLIGTLLGPVFFGAITVLPMYMSRNTRESTNVADIAILDATGTTMGEHIAAALRDRFPLSVPPEVRHVTAATLPHEEDRATLEVQHKERRGYLVVDSATMAGTSARYAGRNAGAMGDLATLTSLVRQQVLTQRLTTAGIDPARAMALTGVRLELQPTKIGDHGREQGDTRVALAVGYLIAFLLYMMIVLYGQMILRGVLEEKTTRVAEVVVSSVSTDTLLAGKVLGVGAVALTQVFAWLGLSFAMGVYVLPLLMKGMTDQPAGPGGAAAAAPTSAAVMAALPSLSLASGAAMLAFFILGFFFYASLFAAVGSMVSSQEDAQQASMPVMLLLISSIIFMTPILTNPASGLARTMTLIPFSAPILMPLRMTLISVPWYEVVGSLVGVALAALVAVWLSARIYRVGLLMYGKRPSISELARWVRYAG